MNRLARRLLSEAIALLGSVPLAYDQDDWTWLSELGQAVVRGGLWRPCWGWRGIGD